MEPLLVGQQDAANSLIAEVVRLAEEGAEA